ncbi:SLC13 family permease [Thermaurantiacus sp.]
MAALAFLLMQLAPAPAGLGADAWLVAALAVAMAILWVTEAIPIAATATLPFLLLPTLGNWDPAAVAANYWSPILFLVLGGAMVARAIERAGLHRRIALGIAVRAKATERGLLFGFMAATAAISTIVSNTAAALIMLPVALALLGTLETVRGARREAEFGKALVLGIAWAATIGGLGTLVGSPTNAIAAGILNRTLGTDISFLSWLAFGLPVVALAIPLAALLLVHLHGVGRAPLASGVVAHAVGRPGPMTVAEKRLLPVLAFLLLGWVVLPLLREPLGLATIDDAIVAMAAALLLLLVPDGAGGRLLTKEDLPALPWEVLLLFGGGLALAAAITDTGLAGWIGAELDGLGELHPLLRAMLLVALMVLVTEFASNVATASGFMPVVAAVATGDAAPLALAMPAAFARTSFTCSAKLVCAIRKIRVGIQRSGG